MIKALTDVTLKKRIREGVFFVLITYSYPLAELNQVN